MVDMVDVFEFSRRKSEREMDDYSFYKKLKTSTISTILPFSEKM
jgi:hypothetical protein